MPRYINGVNSAPEAIGPYSQAVIQDNLVYSSGQIPLDPDTGKIVEGGIEAQADQVMKNLSAILDHLMIDFSHVLKTTIFLTDLNDFAKVNAVYAEWLGEVKPARATVQVAALPLGAQVEIELVAVLTKADEATIPHGTAQSLEELSEQGYAVHEKG